MGINDARDCSCIEFLLLVAWNYVVDAANSPTFGWYFIKRVLLLHADHAAGRNAIIQSKHPKAISRWSKLCKLKRATISAHTSHPSVC